MKQRINRKACAVVGLILGTMAASVVFTHWLARNAARDAVTAQADLAAGTWVRHFASELGGLARLFEGGDVSRERAEMLHQMENFVDVFRYKLFDETGALLLVSDNLDSLASEPLIPGEVEAQAVNALRSRAIVTEVENGAEKLDRPDFYAESYVPVFEDGRAVGVFEVYVDVSAVYQQAQADYRNFGLLLSLGLLGAMAAPTLLIALFWRSLSERNSELQNARDKALAAEAAKARFLANMSHEIRSPMNGVLGMAELLDETKLDETQRLYSRTIRKSATALLELINDILDFSRIEEDKLTLTNKVFSIRDTVEDATALFLPAVMERGLTLEVSVSDAIPAGHVGDAARVRQCLVNLVGNAVKFTERGGVTVAIEPSGAMVRFAVRDTGVGIDPARHTSVFCAFEQADDDDGRRFQGAGLGLSITRRLVELMGGEIGLQSEPGYGSTFFFTLPLPVAAETAVESAPQEPALAVECPTPEAMRTLEHARVLLAEDIATNRMVVQGYLAPTGIDIVVAKDGVEAVEAFRASRPDVVLMDMQMPRKDGLQATEEIRTFEREVGMSPRPIIALTANAMGEDRERCLDAGMDDFLTKPITKDALMDAIKRHYCPMRAQAVLDPAPRASA